MSGQLCVYVTSSIFLPTTLWLYALNVSLQQTPEHHIQDGLKPVQRLYARSNALAGGLLRAIVMQRTSTGSELSHLVIEPRSQTIFLNFEVVARLEVQPESLCCAKVLR